MWKYGIILKCFAQILNIPFLSYSNQYWYFVFCLWNFEKIFRICPWKHLCLKYLCFVFRILPFVCIVIVWLWKHLCLKSHLEEIFAFCLPLLVFVSNQFENTNIKGGRTVRPSTPNCPTVFGLTTGLLSAAHQACKRLLSVCIIALSYFIWSNFNIH